MRLHPLKFICLLSIFGLLLTQLGLILWSDNNTRFFYACFLTAPLLIPLKGLLNGKRYTYKWVGFLTLFYICIGISEAFVNPELWLYSALTTLFSCLLFTSSIYYSRFLNTIIDKSPVLPGD